jgi:hypothetical protein
MRTLLLLAAITMVAAHGEEARTDSIRQKLHAKIMEAFPTPLPEKPAVEKKPADESAVPPVLMKAVIVSESQSVRDLTAWVERERRQREAEKFSIVDGGTLYRKDFGNKRVEMGGWYSPTGGWSFLKISW